MKYKKRNVEVGLQKEKRGLQSYYLMFILGCQHLLMEFLYQCPCLPETSHLVGASDQALATVM